MRTVSQRQFSVEIGIHILPLPYPAAIVVIPHLPPPFFFSTSVFLALVLPQSFSFPLSAFSLADLMFSHSSILSCLSCIHKCSHIPPQQQRWPGLGREWAGWRVGREEAWWDDEIKCTQCCWESEQGTGALLTLLSCVHFSQLEIRSPPSSLHHTLSL